MKSILSLLLLFIPVMTFSQFTHEAHKIEYNEQGKVAFEKVYNVYNREAEDIIRYATKFAAISGGTITNTDKDNHTITIQFSWKVDDINKGNPLYGITITSNVQISAKTARTRIYMSDFMFEGAPVCGASGTIETLLACEEVKKNQKTAIIVFLNEGKPHDILVDYKKQLEKSVKGNSW